MESMLNQTQREGKSIEQYTAATIEQEAAELNLAEESKEGAEKKSAKNAVKNAAITISLSLAMLGDVSWASEEVKSPEIPEKGEKKQEQFQKLELSKEEQHVYNRAIDAIKTCLNQKKDFSVIKNPALRLQAEINDKFVRTMYQGIIEHPETAKISIDLKNKTASFYGTYIDPTTQNELPLFFVYRIQE